MMRVVLLFAVVVLSLVPAAPAAAAPIAGARLFAAGGDVVATYLGGTAALKNDLYIFDAADLSTPLEVTDVEGALGKGVIFTNKETDIWQTVNLGSFAAGSELVFGIYVRESQRTFYLGDGSRNPDGRVHAIVDSGSGGYPFHVVPAGATGVGFEDLFGTESDDDFDDLVFAFTNVRREVAPEPGILALFALGAAAGARRLRRRG